MNLSPKEWIKSYFSKDINQNHAYLLSFLESQDDAYTELVSKECLAELRCQDLKIDNILQNFFNEASIFNHFRFINLISSHLTPCCFALCLNISTLILLIYSNSMNKDSLMQLKTCIVNLFMQARFMQFNKHSSNNINFDKNSIFNDYNKPNLIFILSKCIQENWIELIEQAKQIYVSFVVSSLRNGILVSNQNLIMLWKNYNSKDEIAKAITSSLLSDIELYGHTFPSSLLF